jgi:hypothetical protein
MAELQLAIGDWVLITHKLDRPLAVIGQVVSTQCRHYAKGIIIDAGYKFDPMNFDDVNPGEWPVDEFAIHIERIGPV